MPVPDLNEKKDVTHDEFSVFLPFSSLNKLALTVDIRCADLEEEEEEDKESTIVM